MAGFRDKTILLLVVFVSISAVFIVAKGPAWGIDITGGTRVMLQAESTQVRINMAVQNVDQLEKHVGKIENRIGEGLNVQRPLILENYRERGKLKIQIGKRVTENMIKPLLPEGDKIVPGSLKYETNPKSRDALVDAFRERVDPFGTLGAKFKPVGGRYIRFEVSLPPDKAKTLLGETGRLEIFIDNELVIRGEHMGPVQSVRYNAKEEAFEIPFSFTEEGAERFADGTKGKAGYPGVIYLDRPVHSILLFQKDFERDLNSSVESKMTPIKGIEYSENEHVFRFHLGGRETEHWFPIKVKAFMMGDGGLPPETENYLLEHRGEIRSVIYLGERNELGENLVSGENLVFDSYSLPLKNIPRGGRLAYKWLEKAAGVRSYPTISSDIAGDIAAARGGLSITIGGTGKKTREEAEQLKIVLSQSLPMSVSIQSVTHLNPRLGSQALEEVFKVGVVALIAVGLLVFFRYRRLKIVIPLIITMLCEVWITVGFCSALGESVLTLGLPELGGLIAVVGTGVDHQIIIADELLGKKFSDAKRLPIERRTKKAFSVIFAAAATTIAAMVALAYVGLGAMRGFAIITIVGATTSVLITRPAFAQIIGTLLEREKSN